MTSATILYTYTDEAPMLATHSLLPIVQRFAAAAGVDVQLRDISLAARILAAFSDLLPAEHRVADALAELGALAKTPEANIIKLPNISASQPQLDEAIAELQAQGIALPPYPSTPTTDAERDAKVRYDRVKGSAVNPVLREGNSDRRAPKAVKAYARKHPHSMGAWSPASRTHVATMAAGDFFHHERSFTCPEGGAGATVRIEHVAGDGTVKILKDGLKLLPGEIFDGAFMSRRALQAFFAAQVADAREQGVLFSVHLKATMMKVSDPILFGYAVEARFAEVFATHGELLRRCGADSRQGLAQILAKARTLSADEGAPLLRDLEAALAAEPAIAMVDSDNGVTNLHVPSDVIVDASMPAMIRSSGKMWDRNGKLQDCKAVLPDSSYAGLYQEVLDDCRAHGAFDPRTMGSVPNVGLMAQKAEEYGSHDKTFEVQADGRVRVVLVQGAGPQGEASGAELLGFDVERGDIWRACQTRHAPILNWVELAVGRARATGAPAVFWLDEARAHDSQVIAKVRRHLATLDTAGLDLPILAPAEAMRLSLQRIRQGLDTISVTGNVLRDYLTDLFPILELGTSAKMLSVVPLMDGGGLFETGAGGSAPKHVDQLVQEGYLRWDSLGEFLALAVSFEHLADHLQDPAQIARVRVLADTLDEATGLYLDNDKSPARKVGQIDNRGSHFFLALYWAQALAAQTRDAALAARFAPVAAALTARETAIDAELKAAQGQAVDLGGYYRVDAAKADAAMRPSPAFNAIVDAI